MQLHTPHRLLYETIDIRKSIAVVEFRQTARANYNVDLLLSSELTFGEKDHG